MALFDADSYYVAGYFEETKLSHIHPGAPVTIRVMGEDQPLSGHVEGRSAGIDDRERTTAAGSLLANVNPTFSWVRLAQRVPVRIARSEEHTSELQSLMRTSYAVFCLQQKKLNHDANHTNKKQ